MHPLALSALSALALATGAAAQTSPANIAPEKVSGPTRHAGIYHVASGTWTRTGNTVANMGPDTVYSNTAPSGYFSSAGGAGGFAPMSTNFDEGNLPGTQNANNPGDRDTYVINGVEIGYCDMGTPGSGGWEISFYSSYAPCTFDGFPDSTLQTAGLPAGGCWTVTFDLTGGNEFCMAADGGDGFDDDPTLDSFGWSFRYAGTDGTAPAGFLLSGDPSSTDPGYFPGAIPSAGTNTYFGPPSLCGPDQATGLLTQDLWWLEDPTSVSSNCYFFGAYSNNVNGCGGPLNPYASWHLELQADTGTCQSCICGPTGCLSNPTGTGMNATMTITGSSSVAADNVTLTAAFSPNSFGFFLTSQTPGFAANPGGSAGNLCLGSDLGRFQQLAMSSGSTGTISISTLSGQWSVQNIPQASGPYAAVPGSTSYFQCWFRVATSTLGSNFTDGTSITWIP